MNRVFMSKRNGQLVVGKPIYLIYNKLFSRDASISIENAGELGIVSYEQHQCIGYAIFMGDECFSLITHEQIAAMPIEDLGEL